jgi:hypothetical protein
VKKHPHTSSPNVKISDIFNYSNIRQTCDICNNVQVSSA